MYHSVAYTRNLDSRRVQHSRADQAPWLPIAARPYVISLRHNVDLLRLATAYVVRVIGGELLDASLRIQKRQDSLQLRLRGHEDGRAYWSQCGRPGIGPGRVAHRPLLTLVFVEEFEFTLAQLVLKAYSHRLIDNTVVVIRPGRPARTLRIVKLHPKPGPAGVFGSSPSAATTLLASGRADGEALAKQDN
jgi:hypothetical protein